MRCEWFTERTRELMVSSTLADAAACWFRSKTPARDSTRPSSKRLFEPFFQRQNPKGLGMGLSICRSIVESHRGRLWASPRVPHGAAIRFTVPAELTQ